MLKPSPRRLVIVSHVVHYRHGKRLHAWGPYAHELDVWADLFPEVVIAAPCRDAPPPGDARAFMRSNIAISPLPEMGGNGLGAKLCAAVSLPWLCWRLAKVLRTADAVHVRCPGNWGLLGAVLAPLLARRRIAKYAGQWPDYPGEALTFRLQKLILRSRWWGAPVTVYGDWPGQPRHIIPFFTSVMTSEQLKAAREHAKTRRFGFPWRVIFAGRLTKERNVHTLLQAVRILRQKDTRIECHVLGDGPMFANLNQLTHALKLDDCVRFHGAVSFEQVLQEYSRAHFLVLAAKSEGWGKSIVEGMAFGLVCIGSNTGVVPQILASGRGVTVSPGNAQELAGVLDGFIQDPERCLRVSIKAAEWAARYTLDGLRDALRELMEKQWGVALQRVATERETPAVSLAGQ